MNKYFKIIVIASLPGIFLYTCKKDSPAEPAVDSGYNYLPAEIGSYVIYQVDSIHYDDANQNQHDTTRYLLKEKIADVYTDNSGKPALRIERLYKYYDPALPYDSISWSAPRIWHANKSATDFQKVEEDVRYLRLVFPAKEGKKWNGNLYNTLGEKEYEIVSADINESVNSISFDSVLTVKQFDQIDFIEYRYEQEKYARTVGLIFKQRDSLYFHQHDMNDTYPYDDTIGFTYRQKIISYGK